MAKPQWQVRLQDKLTASPLFVVGTVAPMVLCEKCKGDAKGKKVTLRTLVNYNWRTCEKCKFSIH